MEQDQYELIMPASALNDDRVAAFLETFGERSYLSVHDKEGILVKGKAAILVRDILEIADIPYDFSERMAYCKRSYFRPDVGVIEAPPDAVPSDELRSVLSSGADDAEILWKIRAVVGEKPNVPSLLDGK